MQRIMGTIKKISPLDDALMQKAQVQLDNLTKPKDSLGRLEGLAKSIVGMTHKSSPKMEKRVIFTFAADHGVVDEGVSLFPKEVTAQMVYNFLDNGAAINVLARHVGARVAVADLGVASDLKVKGNKLYLKKIAYGTKNMVKGSAMSRDEAMKSIEAGIEIFEAEFKKGMDICCTGEMGIGNTTAASAITAVITGMPVVKVTGRGTGLDDKGLVKKITVIKKAIRINKPNKGDMTDVLAKVGGLEIGGLVGVILAAAANKVPVVIDGFISASAALIAYGIEPMCKDYMIASHCSVESGHKIIWDHLGLTPLLNLNLRLGEGTGAALCLPIIGASVKIMTEMATFKQANVSKEK
jgi:nicotinate-nucleotide--dimethylbenzimidazole phosphoribosyltransferase